MPVAAVSLLVGTWVIRESRDQAEGRYLTSLGLLGRGEKAEALETLRKTLELDPNHLGALGLFASAP